MKGWLFRVLLGLDQLLNAVAGGSVDETVSSRVGRSRSRFGRAFGKVLGVFERDHGLKSLEYTPWGTVDPHHLEPVREDLVRDWEILLLVTRRPGGALTFEEAKAASRAGMRLKYWTASGGRVRWLKRMYQDTRLGEV